MPTQQVESLESFFWCFELIATVVDLPLGGKEFGRKGLTIECVLLGSFQHSRCLAVLFDDLDVGVHFS